MRLPILTYYALLNQIITYRAKKMPPTRGQKTLCICQRGCANWVQRHAGRAKKLRASTNVGARIRASVTLVPVAGLEPARYRYQWILSPSRLPIPSHRRIVQLLYTRLPEKASTFSEIAPAKPRRPPKASAKKRPGCAVPPLSKRTSKSYRPVYGPRPCQNCS